MKKALVRDLIFVVVLMLILSGVTFCKKVASDKADFTIIYSNDLLGETEPCG